MVLFDCQHTLTHYVRSLQTRFWPSILDHQPRARAHTAITVIATRLVLRLWAFDLSPTVMLQPNFNQIAQHCRELHGAAQHATQQHFETRASTPAMGTGASIGTIKAKKPCRRSKRSKMDVSWTSDSDEEPDDLLSFAETGENEILIGHRGDGGGDRGAPSFPSFERSGTWDCFGTTSFT